MKLPKPGGVMKICCRALPFSFYATMSTRLCYYGLLWLLVQTPDHSFTLCKAERKPIPFPLSYAWRGEHELPRSHGLAACQNPAWAAPCPVALPAETSTAERSYAMHCKGCGLSARREGFKGVSRELFGFVNDIPVYYIDK